MSEEITSSVGDTTADGSAAASEETVSVPAYRKLLTQRKNDQEKMRSLQEQLDVINNEKSASAEAKLQEDGEYKKLIELKDAELLKFKEDNGILANEIHRSTKRQAFFGKMEGKLKKNAYENFIDFDSIVIDPSSQQVDSMSVDAAVKSFLDEYGDLVDVGQAKTIPGNPAQALTAKHPSTMNAKEFSSALTDALTKNLTGV